MNMSAFRAVSRLPVIALTGTLLLYPTAGFGQISGLPAVNLGNMGTPVQGMDSGYDQNNGVYLVVSAYINAHGWFVNTQGQVVAGPFVIKTGGGGSFAPRVKFSRDINGGQGGFLVTYAEEGPSNQNILHARVVSYPGVVGQEMTISEGAAYPWIISGSTAISYSRTSGVFFVAWMTTGPGLPLVGRTVGPSGAPLGAIVRLSNDVGIYPGVSWNSATDRFGVSFRDEGDVGYTGFAIVAPWSVVEVRNRFQPVAGQQGATDIDYNPDTGRYVMTWFAQPAGAAWEMRSAEMDSSANVVTSGLLYSKTAGIGFSSLSMAFNPVSRTFLGATLETVGDGTDPVMGFEVNRRGVRTSAMTQVGPGVLARNVRVSSHSSAAAWNVAFNHNTQSALNLVVTTSSTNGGPAGEFGSGGGSSPAPPPPPPSGGCTTPQPASDWVCVNGNWLPPSLVPSAPAPTPSPAPSTSSCSTVQPASDWVCVNGNWLPPSLAPSSPSPAPPPPSSSTSCSTVKPASDWVCVNGDWLPPSLAPSAPAPTSPSSGGCTTVKPASDWICVNGDWVPPSLVCPTIQPGPDWRCVNGNWLPPGMVLHRPNDPLLLGVPGVIPVHTATAVAVRIDVRLREPGRA